MLLKRYTIDKQGNRYKLDIDEVRRGDHRLIKPFKGSRVLTCMSSSLGVFIHNGNGHTYWKV